VFSDSLAAWWATDGPALPGGPVADLSDAQVGTLADSYADLAARPAAVATRMRRSPVMAATPAERLGEHPCVILCVHRCLCVYASAEP
jgi:hypothetical protein